MRHDNVVGRSPARQPTSERYSQPAAEWESGGRKKRGEYEFVLVRIARNTAIHYWVITGQYSATFFFGTNIIRLLFRKQNRDLVKKVAQFSTSKYSRHARRQFPLWSAATIYYMWTCLVFLLLFQFRWPADLFYRYCYRWLRRSRAILSTNLRPQKIH